MSRRVLVCGPEGELRSACAAAVGRDAVVACRPLAAEAPGSLGASPEQVREAIAALGPLSAVVIVLPEPAGGIAALDIPADGWRVTIDKVLTRAFVLVQAAGLALGAAAGGTAGGAVTVVATLDAVGGAVGRAAACAAAAGVVGLVKAAAIEWGRHGVRITMVAIPPTPGDARTAAMLADRTPSARAVAADDVAGAVAYAVAPENAALNGAVLALDGGLGAGLITRWQGADLASNALLQRGLYAAPSCPEDTS